VRLDEPCTAEKSLGITCAASSNGLVRTRMPGGVWRAVRNDRLYSIYLAVSVWLVKMLTEKS
jgi:hypothetical protein